jgi:hypothetical protein
MYKDSEPWKGSAVMNLKEEKNIYSISEKSITFSILLFTIGILLSIQLIFSPIAGSTRIDAYGEISAIVFFILAAVISFGTSRVEFNSSTRVLFWRRRKGFILKTGFISFDEIADIIIDSEKSGDGGFCFRLQVLTKPTQVTIPLTESYSAGFAYYRQIQNVLLDILREEDLTSPEALGNY